MLKFLFLALLLTFAPSAHAERTSFLLVRNVYSSVNVTTSAYVQLVASTARQARAIEIFSSSAETLVLAVGAAAAESNIITIIPGGNGYIPLYIPAGSRVSVKALSATASSGELDINFYYDN